MSKRDVLQEIEKRILRKEEAKKRVAENSTVEGFVLQFIKNIEDNNDFGGDHYDWDLLFRHAKNVLASQLDTIDPTCAFNVSLYAPEGQKPVVNGVTVKWSQGYQARHACDAELFIDATLLLFR
jgi:hypothetical protein